MDTPDDQLRHLRMRVRTLERSLAESEALSLEQIECTHRLEQQLFDAQTQIESHQQALASCRQQNQNLAQRPTQDDLDRHIAHIQELQGLIWDLERRPTVDQVRTLQQQIETSRAEIEMLKLELGRRVDPERFFQLQQELTELKNYANQLGEYAARLPQIQLQHAQSQLQSHTLETELAELKEKLKEMEDRSPTAEVKAQMQAMQDHYQSQIQHLQSQLSIAEAEREALLQELSDQSDLGADEGQRLAMLKHEIEQLRAQVAETDQLQQELAQTRHQLADLEQRPSLDQVSAWEVQFQELQNQVLGFEAQRDQLQAQQKELQGQRDQLQTQLEQAQAELEQRPAPETMEQLRDQIEQLRYLWQEAEAQHQHLQAELDQRPNPEELTTLHQQIEEMKTQWQAAQTQQQQLQNEMDQRPQPEELAVLKTQIDQLQERLSLLELENRELAQRPDPTRFQEALRRQELAEAHHVVSKKQIEKLQKQVDELKAECVQTHAYAQTQEKEVALLERQNQELQDQLLVLTQHQAAQSQIQSQDNSSRELANIQTNTSPRAPITVISNEPKTDEKTQEIPKSRPSNSDRIPTFSVGSEEDSTPDLLRRHSLYKLTSTSKQAGPAGSVQPKPQPPSQPMSPRLRSPRVDLPSFVRRSP